jgi:hypothetical protein
MMKTALWLAGSSSSSGPVRRGGTRTVATKTRAAVVERWRGSTHVVDPPGNKDEFGTPGVALEPIPAPAELVTVHYESDGGEQKCKV